MIKIAEYRKVNGQNPLILDCTIYPKDENETFESMMKRFKKFVIKSEIIKEYRKRDYYRSKSIKRREKHEAAVKREIRAASKYKNRYS